MPIVIKKLRPWGNRRKRGQGSQQPRRPAHVLPPRVVELCKRVIVEVIRPEPQLAGIAKARVDQQRQIPIPVESRDGIGHRGSGRFSSPSLMRPHAVIAWLRITLIQHPRGASPANNNRLTCRIASIRDGPAPLAGARALCPTRQLVGRRSRGSPRYQLIFSLQDDGNQALQDLDALVRDEVLRRRVVVADADDVHDARLGALADLGHGLGQTDGTQDHAGGEERDANVHVGMGPAALLQHVRVPVQVCRADGGLEELPVGKGARDARRVDPAGAAVGHAERRAAVQDDLEVVVGQLQGEGLHLQQRYLPGGGRVGLDPQSVGQLLAPLDQLAVDGGDVFQALRLQPAAEKRAHDSVQGEFPLVIEEQRFRVRVRVGRGAARIAQRERRHHGHLAPGIGPAVEQVEAPQEDADLHRLQGRAADDLQEAQLDAGQERPGQLLEVQAGGAGRRRHGRVVRAQAEYQHAEPEEVFLVVRDLLRGDEADVALAERLLVEHLLKLHRHEEAVDKRLQHVIGRQLPLDNLAPMPASKKLSVDSLVSAWQC
ncbi:hypothetical protein VCV18_001140 [Metarhizium anisopliae]